jgi:creatinine amidohydrolase
MSNPGQSLLLTDLSWVQVQSHLASDSRLIVPIGACDQNGPHLPIGAGTVVAEEVARALSESFGVLRAPAVPYGVNLASERKFAGTASLREKTLHRLVNDLLASWEDHGFTEFVLITAQNHDPHVEAIATVTGTSARVRVLDVLDIDFSELIRGQRVPQHAGEVLTSLMLHLRPELVNLERIEDYPPDRLPRNQQGRVVEIPALSLGTVGYPSLASAETGERIFRYVTDRIRDKVFLEADVDA